MLDLRSRDAKLLAVGELLLVLAVFALHAGWPIPDVNESHYLVKAKHFWNPDWIAGDFFLDPPAGTPRYAEAHLLFYVLTGWLTRLLPLYWYAVVGRVVTWLLLAWAWQRLSLALLPVRWLAPLTAALFVCLNEHFQMAGEWVVGGFEAKSIAYVLVLFALADMVRAHWMRACVLVGAASSMHVLVGGWTAIVLLAVWLSDREQRPTPKQLATGCTIIALLALPGIVPTLTLDRGVPAALLQQSRVVYVVERLPHHLLPGRFRLDAANRFVLLFAAWALATSIAASTPALQRLRRFVLYALSIAALGIALNWASQYSPVWQARVMRYYWFRLADFALPLGATFSLLAAALTRANKSEQPATESARWAGPHDRMHQAGLAAIALVAAMYLAMHGRAVLTADRPRADAPNKIIDYQAWLDATSWAAQNTPADAIFLTPRTSQTFRWYAGRGEVATWKDMPQDARGILEWWDRMLNIYGRDQTLGGWRYKTLAEVPVERLQGAGLLYQAQYALAEADPPLPLPRVYANSAYVIYRLDSDLSHAPPPAAEP